MDKRGRNSHPQASGQQAPHMPEPPDGAAALYPGEYQGRVPGNLPLSLTSFVGRTQELAAIAEALESTRLLTLTGIGGVGKTRLALEVASACLPDYRDGARLVELAALADRALVPGALAAALGVRERPGRPLIDTLASALATRQLLVVLDNCEHLLDACAALAERLLRTCPGLHILATSREPLGIGGEVAWRVPSLSLPGQAGDTPSRASLLGSEAAQLFVARAAAALPGFQLTDRNAAAVARICRRLDGIPLAIELAAARVAVLAVEQLAVRLDEGFRLLTGGSRTALARQQTLWATIDWSYDLLTAPERALFRRLAVFAGGCSLEAIEAVGSDAIARDDVIDVLGHLVAKSLVQKEEYSPPEGIAEARYRLLETVRQYGWERLQEADETATTRRRQQEWCCALAERAESAIIGTEQLTWLARLDIEYDNLRTALDWCAEEDPAAGLRLASHLWPFWRVRGRITEGRGLLDRLIDRAPERSGYRVTALLGAGRLALMQQDHAAARAHLEEGLTLSRALGDRARIVRALRDLGALHLLLGDHAQARTLLDDGLALGRGGSDRFGLGAILHTAGELALVEGDYAGARAFLEEGLAVLRQVGDRWLIIGTLSELGRVALAQSRPERAEALREEGLALARELGAPPFLVVLQQGLGDVAERRGDLVRATALHEASLALAGEVEDRTGCAASLLGLGRVACRQGDFGRAERLLRESLVTYSAVGNRWGAAAVGHALGLVVRATGDAAGASALLRESLALRRAMNERPGIAACLEGLAAVALDQCGDGAAARRPTGWLGAADALREKLGVPRSPVEQADYAATARAAEALLGATAFAATEEAGRARPLAQVIIEALAEESPTGTTAPPAAPGYPSGLTAREVEVLRLITAGRTNDEIAAALYVSPNTVRHHVTHILTKTGSENRAAATAFALRHKLA